MMDLQSSAIFFGASPFGTALLLSLLLTLVLLSVARLALFLGPRLGQLARKLPHFDVWKAKAHRLRYEFLAMARGFAVLLIGISAVAGITEGVTEVPRVMGWDQAFVVAAHQSIGSFEVSLFGFTTELAGRAASIILGFGVATWLLLARERRLLLLWSGGLVGNSVVIQLMKQYYQRPRPEFMKPYLTEVNFSFPSGHAAASLLMYGLLAYIFFVKSHRKFSWKGRLGIVIVVVWIGVFIGTSRLALGVHYPTDVLAGWTVAISWLSVLMAADQFVRVRSREYTGVIQKDAG